MSRGCLRTGAKLSWASWGLSQSEIETLFPSFKASQLPILVLFAHILYYPTIQHHLSLYKLWHKPALAPASLPNPKFLGRCHGGPRLVWVQTSYHGGNEIIQFTDILHASWGSLKVLELLTQISESLFLLCLVSEWRAAQRHAGNWSQGTVPCELGWLDLNQKGAVQNWD